jgi:putative DNA primase/helicase
VSVERDAAVAYARRGLCPFPLHSVLPGPRCGCGNPDCDAIGKHPATSGWQNTIPSVPAAESTWRPGGRERGIGLVCGARSGMWAIDIDPRHGGDKTFQALVDQHGKVPPTWVLQSGRGEGLGLLFRWPADGDIRNSVGKIGPGVDVRGEGGFMVAPPSPHKTGGRARWIYPPGDEPPLSYGPDWLLELARRASPRRDRMQRKQDVVIRAGGRRGALLSLLGVMRSWGANEAVLVDAAISFVENQCLDDDPSTPINWAHVEATARDIARRY